MVLAGKDRRETRRLVFGLVLCLLLCVFAVAAKTALYHPHQEKTQVVTAAKMWSGKSAAATTAATPELTAAVFVLLAFALLPLVVYRAEPSAARREAGPAGVWFSAALFVRPPPMV